MISGISPRELKQLSFIEYYDLIETIEGEKGVKITLAKQEDYEIVKSLKRRFRK